MEYENQISSQQDATATNVIVSKTAKQRGELAELAFMYKAAGLGFGVAKPYGDSERFDFILSFGKQLWRVQVKSTGSQKKGGYQIHAKGTKRRAKYTSEEIDFLVAYIVPEDVWYVVPVAAILRNSLSLFPSGCRPERRYEQYREAWHLMRPPAAPNSDGSLAHAEVFCSREYADGIQRRMEVLCTLSLELQETPDTSSPKNY